MGLAVNHDPVGKGAPIVTRPFQEGHSFVDAEQFILMGWGTILDHYMKVVEPAQDPFGKPFQCSIDCSFEVRAIH